MTIDEAATISRLAIPPVEGEQLMTQSRSRRRHHGLRKRCRCKRKDWPKCPHGWHLNFKPRGGPHYRLSLDRELGKHISTKGEAEIAATNIRAAIHAGTFRSRPVAEHVAVSALTFKAFQDLWKTARGNQLGTWVVYSDFRVHEIQTDLAITRGNQRFCSPTR